MLISFLWSLIAAQSLTGLDLADIDLSMLLIAETAQYSRYYTSNQNQLNIANIVSEVLISNYRLSIVAFSTKVRSNYAISKPISEETRYFSKRHIAVYFLSVFGIVENYPEVTRMDCPFYNEWKSEALVANANNARNRRAESEGRGGMWFKARMTYIDPTSAINTESKFAGIYSAINADVPIQIDDNGLPIVYHEDSKLLMELSNGNGSDRRFSLAVLMITEAQRSGIPWNKRQAGLFMQSVFGNRSFGESCGFCNEWKLMSYLSKEEAQVLFIAENTEQQNGGGEVVFEPLNHPDSIKQKAKQISNYLPAQKLSLKRVANFGEDIGSRRKIRQVGLDTMDVSNIAQSIDFVPALDSLKRKARPDADGTESDIGRGELATTIVSHIARSVDNVPAQKLSLKRKASFEAESDTENYFSWLTATDLNPISQSVSATTSREEMSDSSDSESDSFLDLEGPTE